MSECDTGLFHTHSALAHNSIARFVLMSPLFSLIFLALLCFKFNATAKAYQKQLLSSFLITFTEHLCSNSALSLVMTNPPEPALSIIKVNSNLNPFSLISWSYDLSSISPIILINIFSYSSNLNTPEENHFSSPVSWWVMFVFSSSRSTLLPATVAYALFQPACNILVISPVWFRPIPFGDIITFIVPLFLVYVLTLSTVILIRFLNPFCIFCIAARLCIRSCLVLFLFTGSSSASGFVMSCKGGGGLSLYSLLMSAVSALPKSFRRRRPSTIIILLLGIFLITFIDLR